MLMNSKLLFSNIYCEIEKKRISCFLFFFLLYNDNNNIGIVIFVVVVLYFINFSITKSRSGHLCDENFNFFSIFYSLTMCFVF